MKPSLKEENQLLENLTDFQNDEIDFLRDQKNDLYDQVQELKEVKKQLEILQDNISLDVSFAFNQISNCLKLIDTKENQNIQELIDTLARDYISK